MYRVGCVCIVSAVCLRVLGTQAAASSSSVPDILLLGVLGDRDSLAVGLQFVLDDLAVGIVLHTERMVQHPRDVVVPRGEKTEMLVVGHVSLSCQQRALVLMGEQLVHAGVLVAFHGYKTTNSSAQGCQLTATRANSNITHAIPCV